MTQALPAATTWAAGLIAAGRLSRAGLAVYEREVERYGGPSGISLAELVFAADSIAVAAMLAEPRDALDLMEMAVLSVDHLLAGLGLDEAARLRWYRDAAPPPVESGDGVPPARQTAAGVARPSRRGPGVRGGARHPRPSHRRARADRGATE